MSSDVFQFPQRAGRVCDRFTQGLEGGAAPKGDAAVRQVDPWGLDALDQWELGARVGEWLVREGKK